jgi:hypothetical protein
LSAGDFLPIADVSASETKKITVTDLVGRATTLIADATIPSGKILFGANTIPGSSLTNTSVTATQIANDAVTAAKLADESSVDLVTTLPASGAFVGQLALDTDDSKIYCWNGSTWISVKGAGSVNAVLGSTAGVINIVATTVGDQVTISATLDNTSAAAQFLAGPTAAAGAVGYRTIAGADLPTATTTTKGAVIVNGNGLTLTGDTISINNTVTAEATDYHVVQYNAKGLVTAGRLVDSSDLPVATASTNGIVKPGTGLGVTAGGTVNHTNVVAPATGTKVSFDSEGHVTGTQALVEADIPGLPASKITTGTLDNGRIGTNTIIGSKLANYSVTQIGSVLPTAEHIGQFFFNPLTRDLSLWDGNVYQPVGITAGEIVFAGTYNANTNTLNSVTSDGAAAGFVNGNPLPAATAANSRYYVVVSQLGTGTAPAPAVTLEPPDILLSNGSTYILIEVSQTFTSQSAVNVAFTPTGTISAANVQAAIAEVASESLQTTGGTITGQLLIGPAGTFVFEGATDNTFETTLGVVDPTADRTINLPNVSGTVITTGDTGTVTSTMIADGTITNTDINASAAIAYSKLASLTSGNIVLGDATNVATSTAVTGDVTISNTGVTSIASGAIVNADINASAAISYSKLASLTSGNILIGNASNVPTSTAVTGDVTISNTGVTSISSGVIVNAEINASAAIDYSKLAPLTSGNILLGDATNVATSTAVTGDITISNTGVTAIASGVIVNADISTSAAIAYSKLATLTAGNIVLGNAGNVATSTAVTGDVTISSSGVTAISSGVIVNADISASAAISGSKIVAGTTSVVGVVQLTDSTSSTSTTTAATPNSVKSAYDLANAALPKTGGVLTGDLTLNAQADLRFADADSSNWLALQAPTTVTSNVTWTLPAADGTVGQVLSTNGTGTLSWQTSAASILPSGTRLLFVQTNAPTGWTKDTTQNDKALRVVSGSASTGGTTAFSTVFTSRTPAGTVGNTTLTVSQIPAHNHFIANTSSSGSSLISTTTYLNRNNATAEAYDLRGGVGVASVGLTSDTGGGTAHNHSFTGTALDFAVQYVDVIIATKD